jgi:ComEC/Rec2-related protein
VSAVLPAAALSAAMHLLASVWLPASSAAATGAGVLVVLGMSVALTAPPSGRPDSGRFAFIVCCGLAIGYATVAVAAVSGRVRLPVVESELAEVTGELREMSGSDRERLVVIGLLGARSSWVGGTASGEIRALVPADDAYGGSREPRVGDTITIAVGESVWRDRSDRLWVRGTVSGVHPGAASANAIAAAARIAVRASIDDVAGRAGPLLAALLLGDGADVDPRVDLLFRRSGTIHLLALSGMHLAVIALLVRGALRPLVGPMPAAIAAFVAAVLYVVLVGPRPGLVRACLLVGIATVFTGWDRRRPLVELLAAAFLVQLVIQPDMARTLGFQLSYLSLLGISLVSTTVAAALRAWIPASIASPLAAGTGAQLLTVPLLLARFGRWYPVGIVASLVMGPVILVFMSAGLVAVLLSMAGVSAVRWLSVPVLELLSRAAEWSGWFFSGVPTVAPAGLTGGIVLSGLAASAAVALGLICLYGNRNEL